MMLCGGIGSPTISGRPLRAMCAFSRPIDSRSGPRYSTWSMSMLVMTETSASTALTASSGRRGPTSRITRSTGAARQRAHDGQRGELEEVSAMSPRAASTASKCGIRSSAFDHLAVEAATLLEVHEVRLDVRAHLVAGGQRDRLEHRAGRALAVGAGDAHDRHVELQRRGARSASSCGRASCRSASDAGVRNGRASRRGSWAGSWRVDSATARGTTSDSKRRHLR